MLYLIQGRLRRPEPYSAGNWFLIIISPVLKCDSKRVPLLRHTRLPLSCFSLKQVLLVVFEIHCRY